MKNKVILFFALLISSVIFISKTYNAVKIYSKKEDDTQISILNQKVQYQLGQKFNKLLSKEVVSFNFRAQYNNLGTVEVLFDTNKRMNYDWLSFRIKEKGSSSWYYQNKYKTDQFSNDRYFPFGFPVINNSQNKEYVFEIESISGAPDDSVSLNRSSQNFIVKYSYSKAFLKQHKFEIIFLLVNKIRTLSRYIPTLDKISIIISSLMPLMIGLIILIKPLKIINKILKLGTNKKISQIFNWVNPISLFLITFLVSGYFSTIGTDPHHDGILIKPAVDLLEGKMLFRDSFTQYGALTTILQTVALRFFGEFLITIKLETAFFYGLISVLLYFIWSRFMSKKLAFFSGVILLFLAPYYIFTFLPWSSVYALFFQCLTLYFLIKYHEDKNNYWLFFAGAATALTFWSKQNVGAYVLAPSIIYILIIRFFNNKKKLIIPNLIQYIGGVILTSLFFLAWIVVNGALIDWWKQSIVFAAGFIEAKSETNLIASLFPAFVAPQYVGIFSIWAVMPVITILAFFKGLFEKKPNTMIVLTSLFSLFSWLQYYPITDIRHVFWSAAPMVGIVVYLLFELCKSISNDRAVIKFLLFIFLIWVIFYPDIIYRVSGAYKKVTKKYNFLNNPKILKGMKLTKDEAFFYSKTYQAIVDYKKTYGDVNFITNSPNALYLTFTKSENFHPMYVDWGNNIYPDYYLIKNDYIEKNKPLIMSIWGQIHPGYCRVNNLVGPADTAFLIVPCEK